MASLGSLVVRVGANIADFTSDMGRASKISKQQSAAIKRNMLAAGTAVVGGLALATKAAAEFQTAMAEVQTLMDDTSGVDAATESVKKLSIQYGMAPVDQAKALYQIISAGASDASDQMILLEASNRLAIGGVTDVTTAADGLTGVLNAYGLKAESAGKISDVMFATMKAGKTTIAEVAANISQVTPIAATMGVTFDEVGAALATVTAITGNTAIASTQLRQAITSIGAPAEKSKKMFAELGLEFGKTAIEMKGGLLPYMQEVIEKTGGSTIKLKKLFGSVEAVNGVLALATNDFEKFGSALQSTTSSAGETDKAFEKMSKTLEFKLKKLKALFDVFKVTIGSALLPVISKLADSVGEVGTEMDSAKKAGDFFANTLKVLLTAGIVVKNLFEALGIVIGNFAGIVVSVFTGIGRTIGAFVDGVGRSFTLLKEGEFKLAGEAITEIADGMGSAFTDAKNEIADGISAIGQGVAGELTDGVESMKKLWDDAVDSTQKASDALEEIVVTAERMPAPVGAAVGEVTDTLEEIVVTAERMPVAVTKVAKEIKDEFSNPSTGVAAVIENSFKRLDDTFSSFWSNLLKDGKFSLKGIKDLFLDTIAQMLHAALTQPIVLRIGAMMTGGLASGAANASGGGSLFGGGINSLGSLWGAQGGLMGVGENIAGLAGGYLGYQLGGNTNTGGQIGSAAGGIGLGYVGGAIGGIIGGPLGAVVGKAIGAFVGGLLGNFVGGLFGSNPRIKAGGSGFFSNKKDTQFFDSQFGGVFVGKTKGGMDEHVAEFGQALVEFDNTLAGFMSNAQIEKVSEALRVWGDKMKGDAISIEDLLNSRFSAILNTFGQNVQSYVMQFEGLEAQADALARFVTALNTVGATISNFIAADPSTVLAQQLDEASKTSTERLFEISNNLMALFDSFDGTPEMLDQISQAVDARYRGEMEYLTAINQLIQAISNNIAAQQQGIRDAIEGPRTFSELMSEAMELRSGLGGAGSPEELAQMVSSIQNLVQQAFSGLDAEGQLMSGRGLIRFLDEVESSATERAEQLAQMVIDEGVILREQAQLFADSIGAPLDLNVQATNDVGAAISRQTDIITDGNESNDTLLRELIGLIRAGADLDTVRP